MKAMILAAGLGTRLRPYSESRPKPLFPVLGRPLVLHLLDQLRNSGCREFVVNTHFLSEQFEKKLVNEQGVFVQIEKDILGTGGGLRMARSKLGTAPFLAINGDILHSLDPAEIYSRHLASGAPVSLVVHNRPRFNNLRVAPNERVTAFRVGAGNIDSGRGERLLAFTGIQIIDPALLDKIPGGFFDIIDLYRQLVANGTEINAIEVSGHFWTDIGTLEDYLALHEKLLTYPALIDELGLDVTVNKPVHCTGDTVLGRSVKFRDWAFVGSGVRIGDNARISRAVIWDGAIVPAGALIEDEIVVR